MQTIRLEGKTMCKEAFLMKKKLFLLLFCLKFSFCFCEAFDFVEKEFSEIFYALSLYSGVPIFGDDTVFGKGSFHLAGDDFENAFDSFLLQNRLYVKKGERGWLVSRCKFLSQEGLFCLDACDLYPVQLLEKTAVETGICITYDSLPKVPVSIHTGFCSPEEIVKRIAGLCTGFEVKKENSGVFHVGRTSQDAVEVRNFGRAVFLEDENGFWTCDVQNSNLSGAIEKFFLAAGKQFCLVGGGEGRIQRSYFKGKNFDDSLSLLCAQADVEVLLCQGVYYLVPSKSERKKLENSGRVWRSVHLNNGRCDEFAAAAGKRFSGIQTVLLNPKGDFLYSVDEKELEDFLDFTAKFDSKNDSHLVQLKYLRTEEFFASLPPFVDKSAVCDTGRGDSFFFTGDDEGYKKLLEKLELVDKPVNRVTYDLLIVQYQNSKAVETGVSFGMTNLADSTVNSISAQLGSVLDFNMDIAGAFGLKFAASLQASLNETKARIFADTTLNGVSGRPISFQNTNTYRYRDNNLDPETGKPVYSGVTREIVSGLKLEVTGTVTGDGMITTKITASVSRQGADTSSKTGNPPPSSEKIVSTEVRTKSGEPVVLSGLVQNEESKTSAGVPFLSKIPLLGKLFKSENSEMEKTEMVIYLVPHTEIFGSEKNSMQDKEKIFDSQEEKNHRRALLKELKVL